MSLPSPIRPWKAGRPIKQNTPAPLQGHLYLCWQVVLQLQELRIFRYDS